jgi:hypothetical protein
MTAIRLAAAALAALAAPAAFADSSLRCAGGIVSVGDSALDLLAKCGPPALRDRRVDERWRLSAGSEAQPEVVGVGQRTTAVLEDWSYDFGPNAFTYVVKLENGRVVDFVRGGYGHRPDSPPARPVPPRARCEENTVREGDTKLDVLVRCGEPALRDVWEGERGRIEVWTYDHGRDRLVRYVQLEDGRVVKVRTGSYGYAD